MKYALLILSLILIVVVLSGCKSITPASQEYVEGNAQNINDLVTLVNQQNKALVAILPELQGFDYNLSLVQRNTEEQLDRSAGIQIPPVVQGIGSAGFKMLDAQTGGLLGGVVTALGIGGTMYARHKRNQWLQTPTKDEEKTRQSNGV